MNTAAAILLKHNDFAAFSKSRTQVKTTLCDIHEAVWKYNKSKEQLIFNVSANRYLRGMVRGIVGTCLKVGIGKIQPAEFQEIIEKKLRPKVDFSAPAKGLYLIAVKYPFALESF